jgi:hypothetical protein
MGRQQVSVAMDTARAGHVTPREGHWTWKCIAALSWGRKFLEIRDKPAYAYVADFSHTYLS